MPFGTKGVCTVLATKSSVASSKPVERSTSPVQVNGGISGGTGEAVAGSEASKAEKKIVEEDTREMGSEIYRDAGEDKIEDSQEEKLKEEIEVSEKVIEQ